MRIWDIDPGFLNDKSLLGEHRELHGMVSIIVNNKKGYSRHPETLRWIDHLGGLVVRHDLLVAEMTLRGFNHKSPLDPHRVTWPDHYIDLPHVQLEILREKYRHKEQGRIPLPVNAQTYWASCKYSVMARDPALYREIGPALATGSMDMELLAEIVTQALRQPPPKSRLINALQHMWGYVNDPTIPDVSDMSPCELLAAIVRRVKGGHQQYLHDSTALGELGYWCDRT